VAQPAQKARPPRCKFRMNHKKGLALRLLKCSFEHVMPFTFQIHPIGLDAGFELSCEGVLPENIHHHRLIDAIIHAVQMGHHLDGKIQVFDCDGNVAEVLPVRWEEKPPAYQLAA
jgi:hypothetical protein